MGTPANRVANYVVAYEATDRGNEAVELGVALARLTGAELRLCLVLQHSSRVPADVPPSEADGLRESQGREWLSAGMERVPSDVTATANLIWAESTSEGLLNAVKKYDSDRIVVGASRDGLLQRFTIGSVASALLHSSPVPVALAPRGYRAPKKISRITCAVGTRAGWRVLLDSVVSISKGHEIDLRFATLVSVDTAHAAPIHSESEQTQGDAHLAAVLEYFSARSTAKGEITTEVAIGHNVEAAVEAMDWLSDEIAIAGSSRLAQPNRTFLGITANRMLHSLPVPLIVVPTTHLS